MMNKAEMRQWVEANPGRVNDGDTMMHTPLYSAASHKKIAPLTVWLLDERGADVNGTTLRGTTPLLGARTLDVLIALLDRDADPILPDSHGTTPLMDASHFWIGRDGGTPAA
jgi:ankyrin repeat protein